MGIAMFVSISVLVLAAAAPATEASAGVPQNGQSAAATTVSPLISQAIKLADGQKTRKRRAKRARTGVWGDPHVDPAEKRGGTGAPSAPGQTTQGNATAPTPPKPLLLPTVQATSGGNSGGAVPMPSTVASVPLDGRTDPIAATKRPGVDGYMKIPDVKGE